MKKQVMARAWKIYRTLTGDRIAKLKMAMKRAWAEIKALVASNIGKIIVDVPQWLINKNLDAQERCAVLNSGESPIVDRETAKAVLAKWSTKFGTIAKWLPKSQIKIGERKVTNNINTYKDVKFSLGSEVILKPVTDRTGLVKWTQAHGTVIDINLNSKRTFDNDTGIRYTFLTKGNREYTVDEVELVEYRPISREAEYIDYVNEVARVNGIKIRTGTKADTIVKKLRAAGIEVANRNF